MPVLGQTLCHCLSSRDSTTMGRFWKEKTCSKLDNYLQGWIKPHNYLHLLSTKIRRTLWFIIQYLDKDFFFNFTLGFVASVSIALSDEKGWLETWVQLWTCKEKAGILQRDILNDAAWKSGPQKVPSSRRDCSHVHPTGSVTHRQGIKREIAIIPHPSASSWCVSSHSCLVVLVSV